jgi:hypothetical protein
MENKPKFRPDPDAKLMDQVREVLRYYHYAYRAESTYCQWILRYSLSKIPSFVRWMRYPRPKSMSFAKGSLYSVFQRQNSPPEI